MTVLELISIESLLKNYDFHELNINKKTITKPINKILGPTAKDSSNMVIFVGYILSKHTEQVSGVKPSNEEMLKKASDMLKGKFFNDTNIKINFGSGEILLIKKDTHNVSTIYKQNFNTNTLDEINHKRLVFHRNQFHKDFHNMRERYLNQIFDNELLTDADRDSLHLSMTSMVSDVDAFNEILDKRLKASSDKIDSESCYNQRVSILILENLERLFIKRILDL